MSSERRFNFNSVTWFVGGGMGVLVGQSNDRPGNR